MRSRELTPELVRTRLDRLRQLAPAPEPVPDPAHDRPDRDMSPAAVGRRLDELRALDQLATWLTGLRPPA